jgi:hypothetical protein
MKKSLREVSYSLSLAIRVPSYYSYSLLYNFYYKAALLATLSLVIRFYNNTSLYTTKATPFISF